MTRLRRQIEAYRMARRIVRACNRMKAGQGVALQHCMKQRAVLEWMAQRVEMGLRRRKSRKRVIYWADGTETHYTQEERPWAINLNNANG